jgi:PKD repeat protein
MGILPFYKNGEIRVSGTRGFWKSSLFEVSLPVAQPMVASKNIDCFRTQVQFDDYSVLNHTDASWNWSFPGASTVSSTTIRNPIVTYTTPGFYDVTLTVTDGNAKSSTKTLTNIIEVLPSTCTIETASLKALEMNTSTEIIFADNLTYGSTPNITFTGWIKPNGIQADWTGIVCLGRDLVLGFSENNEMQFHPNWWAPTGLVANAGEWNFVAIRYTPTQVTIFLNDKQWTLDGLYSPIELNSIIFGKHNDSNERTYKGQMDEFTLWNRALSDQEIYLSRHLIKENSTDSNLIAYYQFNNIENFGLLYDKKNTNDLSISSSINFHLSTAPVGVGTSQLRSINATGTYDFPEVNANLNFTGQVPNGNVVVSKLNVSPNEAPVINPTGNEYWILNNYGTNISFDGLSSVDLLTAKNVSNISASNFSIYKRESNGYIESGWSKATTATSVTTNKINFSGANLDQSLQWFIGSSIPLGIDNLVSQKSFVVYPNPYVQGQTLKIDGIDTASIFSLFDINGKIILKKEVNNKEIDLNTSVSKGIYFYRIETANKLYNGKLVIE